MNKFQIAGFMNMCMCAVVARLESDCLLWWQTGVTDERQSLTLVKVTPSVDFVCHHSTLSHFVTAWPFMYLCNDCICIVLWFLLSNYVVKRKVITLLFDFWLELFEILFIWRSKANYFYFTHSCT